jgi:hypothetical protein
VSELLALSPFTACTYMCNKIDDLNLKAPT